MDRLNYPAAHIHACRNKDCQVDMGYCYCRNSALDAFLCEECEEKLYVQEEGEEEDIDDADRD